MAEINWKRIMVATDLSACAEKAVEVAHSLAAIHDAELHVLHVAKNAKEMLSRHGGTGTFEPGEPEDEGAQWLATLLGESGTVRRIEVARIGDDPAETILNYARLTAIDLIVVATHGRTGLTHLLLGSVAEKILRRAPCPVLVIRAEAQT